MFGLLVIIVTSVSWTNLNDEFGCLCVLHLLLLLNSWLSKCEPVLKETDLEKVHLSLLIDCLLSLLSSLLCAVYTTFRKFA